MFGDGSDSGSSGISGSSAGLSSNGFSGSSNDSSCNSGSLGNGLGGYGSVNSSSYSSPDGGVHSSLNTSSMAAPSGGSSTPNTDSLGSQATNDVSTQASTPSTSYASPQAINDNSSTPAGGFSNPQTDTSGTPAGDPTGGFANSNSNDSTRTAGVSLDGSGFSGFSPNTTNDNANAPTLNGAAGSSLSPSLGITGGTPYTNGFSFDSSTTTHDLSTITPNYDNDMSHYFNDTSGIQKTEGTLAKIDSAWDTVAQLADKYVVQPVQAAYNNYVVQPLNNVESAISTTYDEGAQTVKSLIHDDKALDNIINHPENIQRGEVTLGALQFVGGITEAATGYTIVTGGTVASGGLAAAPSILGGGYLAIDGASNFRGGVSRIGNGLEGSMAGDTANFVKNTYIAVGASKDKIYSGENIYNATQLGIGAFTIGKGVNELPGTIAKVENSWLGYQSVTKGAETYTDISATMKAIDINTWTNEGLFVKSVNINIPKVISGISLIGVDINNAYESKKSIK